MTVDVRQTFQVIRGWEAVAQAGLYYSTEHLEELLDEAVDLGITRLRVEIRPSLESNLTIQRESPSDGAERRVWNCTRYSTSNDNLDPQRINWGGFTFDELDEDFELVVLPLRRRLAEVGERLWVHMQYVGFNEGCTNYEYAHADPDEYAEYVLAVYQHLQARHGLLPDSWGVSLEPDNTDVWTPDHLALAMERTADRLLAAGFVPRFAVPDAKNPRTALRYFETVWDRSELRRHVLEFSYHRYGRFGPADIARIGRTAANRGVDSAMLEHIGAREDELHEDLTLGRVSTWQQFTLGFPGPDTGGHYLLIDLDAPVGQQISLSSTARFLRLYFRAIRPGAIRLGASSNRDDLKPVAFRNRDGELAIVVTARSEEQFTIRGLEAGDYRVECWTEHSRPDVSPNRCEADLPVDDSGTLVTSLPAGGVLSVVRTEGARQ